MHDHTKLRAFELAPENDFVATLAIFGTNSPFTKGARGM
jgi:hypothetical protein